jgi:hypothetical protein
MCLSTKPYNIRFEVFTAMTMKNGVFWMLRRVALVRTDVSEEISASFIRMVIIGELGRRLAVTSNQRTLRRLPVAASVVPSSPILVTLIKEALGSSETSVLTRATRRNIQKTPFFETLQVNRNNRHNDDPLKGRSVCLAFWSRRETAASRSTVYFYVNDKFFSHKNGLAMRSTMKSCLIKNKLSGP